jgi:cellulose synthase/poly-beta-1,6-N-acetylglucosamine synthase-like glycosyltransferase
MGSWTDYVLGPAIVLAVMGLGLLSLLQNTVPLRADATIFLLLFDTRVLVLVAVCLFGGSFLLFLWYLRGEDPSRSVTEGRTVEAVVPVYEDAGVMHQSVEHLADSDYADLVVTIVCEPDDDASIRRAEALAERHEAVGYILNESATGSKAAALNTAIERSSADAIALFDADQRPHPTFLSHAMASLENHDAARGRSLPSPEGGVLESVVYYEYLVLFFLPQKLARALFGFNFACTRTVVYDASVFRTVGAFREDQLTEDLDFSHRCNEAGLSIRELLYRPTYEEPAHGLRDWWGQRVRWMSGQVAISTGKLRNSGSLLARNVLGSVVTSLGTFVAGTLMAMTLPKLALGLVASPLVVGGGLAAVFAALLATRYVDTRVAGLEGFGLAWLLLPVAVTLYGLVILQVVFQYALGIEPDWYHVEKVDGSK